MKHHRTIFISDVHLGTRGCKAEYLAAFLTKNTCDQLYLVGDIIDGWHVKNWYWSDDQSRVVRAIKRHVEQGGSLRFTPGNHDEFLRLLGALWFAEPDIAIQDTFIHHTVDGKRILVLHGDQFDNVMQYARWLALAGDRLYGAAMWASEKLNVARRAFGLPYWSFSAWLKHTVKHAVQFISRFENTVAEAAHARDVDAVLCGHIHSPAMRQIGDVLYLNDGDWVESCSAITEDYSGKLEVVRWPSSNTIKE